MWFTFYQKMTFLFQNENENEIYYEISFPLTIIFKYFCQNFIINDIYLHLHFIKNFRYSRKQITGV